MVTGYHRYADAEGISYEGNVYVWQEMEDAKIEGNISRASSRLTSNGAFIFTRAMQTITCRVSVPKDDKYYLFLRIVHHGNTFPNFTWTLDGQAMPAFTRGKFGWNRLTEAMPLTAGEHTITFTENGKEPTDDPSNRIMAFDAMQLATNPATMLSEQVTVNPQDPKDNAWMAKPFVPLRNPTLVINGVQVNITYTFDEGEPVLLFADGRTAAVRPITVQGTVPATAGQPDIAVRLIDVAESSHKAVVRHWPGRDLPVTLDPAVLTPNGDAISDAGRVHAAPTGVTTLDIVDADDQVIADGRALDAGWDGQTAKGASAPAGYYLVRGRTNAGARIALGVVQVREEPPLIDALPRVFSPNGDTVCDTTSITFTTWPKQPKLVVEGANGLRVELPVVSKGPQRWAAEWNGKLADGRVVPDGKYQCRVLDGDRQLMARQVELNTQRRWPGIVNPHKDWFPIGMWMSPVLPSQWDATFTDLKAHGMNAVMVHGDPAVILPAAERHGVRVFGNLTGEAEAWLHTPKADFNEFTTASYFEGLQKRWSVSPAFAGYYFSDEPTNNADRALRMHTLFRVTQGLDPAHPPLMVLIGGNRIKYYMEQVAQPIPFFDIYPAMWGSQPGDFHKIYATKQEMMEYLGDAVKTITNEREQSMWIVVQTHAFHGWHREPTPAEIRQMVYLELAVGAKGLFYFFYQTQQSWVGLIDKDGMETARYREVAKINREVAAMAPTLLKLVASPTPGAVLRVAGGGNPFYEHGWASLRYHPEEQRGYLFVVNRDLDRDSAMEVSLDLEALGYRPVNARDLRDGSVIRLQRGRFNTTLNVTLPAGDGRVYKLE
jgi:flagellar hook assembly protein FlgD